MLLKDKEGTGQECSQGYKSQGKKDLQTESPTACSQLVAQAQQEVGNAGKNLEDRKMSCALSP